MSNKEVSVALLAPVLKYHFLVKIQLLYFPISLLTRSICTTFWLGNRLIGFISDTFDFSPALLHQFSGTIFMQAGKCFFVHVCVGVGVGVLFVV